MGSVLVNIIRSVPFVILTFGYYRYETRIMLVTVVLLIVLVQVVQTVGDMIATRVDRK